MLLTIEAYKQLIKILIEKHSCLLFENYMYTISTLKEK